VKRASLLPILVALAYAAIVTFFFIVLVQAAPQDPCHDDEIVVTDSRGQHCAPKPKALTFRAKDCVRDFKPTDSTILTVPLYGDGSPDLSGSTLSSFEYKLICGVPK